MLLLEKIGETPGHICSLKFFGAIYHHLPSSKKKWYFSKVVFKFSHGPQHGFFPKLHLIFYFSSVVLNFPQTPPHFMNILIPLSHTLCLLF